MSSSAHPRVARQPGHRQMRSRAAGVALGVVLSVGSLVMWLGIPAGWLWVFSRTGNDYLKIYLETLAASPPTMAALGWCLYRLNRIYLSVTEHDGLDLLELSMTVSVILAVAAVLVWLIFLGPAFHLPAQGAW